MQRNKTWGVMISRCRNVSMEEIGELVPSKRSTFLSFCSRASWRTHPRHDWLASVLLDWRACLQASVYCFDSSCIFSYTSVAEQKIITPQVGMAYITCNWQLATEGFLRCVCLFVGWGFCSGGGFTSFVYLGHCKAVTHGDHWDPVASRIPREASHFLFPSSVCTRTHTPSLSLGFNNSEDPTVHPQTIETEDQMCLRVTDAERSRALAISWRNSCVSAQL